MTTSKIQVRRDTAANWTNSNPTLSDGEIGFETDTGKFKIGNNSTAWVSLSYSSNDGAQGAQGIAGNDGAQGAQGIAGNDGAQGIQGSNAGILSVNTSNLNIDSSGVLDLASGLTLANPTIDIQNGSSFDITYGETTSVLANWFQSNMIGFQWGFPESYVYAYDAYANRFQNGVKVKITGTQFDGTYTITGFNYVSQDAWIYTAETVGDGSFHYASVGPGNIIVNPATVITPVEISNISYLDNTTSNVQSQLNSINTALNNLTAPTQFVSSVNTSNLTVSSGNLDLANGLTLLNPSVKIQGGVSGNTGTLQNSLDAIYFNLGTNANNTVYDIALFYPNIQAPSVSVGDLIQITGSGGYGVDGVWTVTSSYTQGFNQPDYGWLFLNLSGLPTSGGSFNAVGGGFTSVVLNPTTTITTTEIKYLDGLTSNIQSQLSTIQSTTGAQGAQGIAGNDGAQGIQGLSGAAPIHPAFMIGGI